MAGPTEVLTPMPDRLRAAEAAVKDAEGPYRLRIKQRDELVVEAIDGGMTQLEVAKLIGKAKGRISAILAASQPDDDGD